MKKLILPLAALSLAMFIWSFTPVEAPAKEGTIEFIHDDFQKAKEQAAKEGKRIFLDAYTSWCHYCKKMGRTTYKNEKVGAYFNENYINLKINMEKGAGPKLAKQFGVSGYPTFLILDEEGNLVAKSPGYKKAKDLLAFGEKYKK